MTEYAKKQQLGSQNSEVEEEPVSTSCLYLLASYGLAFASLLIIAGVWALDKYAFNNVQGNYYYRKSLPVSVHASLTTYTDSTVIYPAGDTSSIKAVAASLLCSWMMWKFSLVAYSYVLVSSQPSKVRRFVSWGLNTALLIGADIALTALMPTIYTDWMFFASFVVVTTVLALINAVGTDCIKQKVLLDCLLPLTTLGLMLAIMVIGLPIAYKNLTTLMTGFTGQFLFVYGYPLIDVLMSALTVWVCSSSSKQSTYFSGVLYWLLYGYGIGLTARMGFTEVEFYFLLIYMCLRNFFATYLLESRQTVKYAPACLPIWLLLYAMGVVSNFAPLNGLGNIVIAVGYSTEKWRFTPSIIYPISNPQYSMFYSTPTTTPITFNSTFTTIVPYLSFGIIWIALTITARPNLHKHEPWNLAWNVLGGYLWFFGVMAAFSVDQLGKLW